MRKLVLASTLLLLLAAAGPAASKRAKQKQTGISDLETPVATFHGTLKSLTKKQLILTMPEDQEITFDFSRKTRFVKDGKPIKSSQIQPGAPLSVDGKRDVMGNTEAVTVTVEAPKPPPAESTPVFR